MVSKETSPQDFNKNELVDFEFVSARKLETNPMLDVSDNAIMATAYFRYERRTRAQG